MVGIFGKFKKQSLVRKENIRNSGAQTHKEIMDKRKIKHMRNRPSVFLGKYEKQDYAEFDGVSYKPYWVYCSLSVWLLEQYFLVSKHVLRGPQCKY